MQCFPKLYGFLHRIKPNVQSQKRNKAPIARATLVFLFIPILLYFGSGTNVLAGEITVRYQGMVTFVNTTVIDDITTNSSIELILVYDSDAIPPTGMTMLSFDAPPAGSLNIRIGPYSFNEQQDLDYGSGFPFVTFVDGGATALNMVVVDAIPDPLSDLDVQNNDFLLSNPVDGDVVRGTIDFTSPQLLNPPQVSVPFTTSFYLLGLSLFVGLIGATRALRA